MWTLLVALVGGPVAIPSTGVAQDAEGLRVVRADGEVRVLEAASHREYRAVPVGALETLGWSVTSRGSTWTLRHEDGVEVDLVPGDPWFVWDDRVQQLVDPPYRYGGQLWVPAQLVLDFLPFHLDDRYRLVLGPEGPELRLLDGRAAVDPMEPLPGADPVPQGEPEPLVVVIDPGHGGRDLGALGPGGTREKDVALALGRALARELGRYPELEVHLTRDSDVLVPIWRRGEWATEVKGDRSGVFISLHANAMPADRATRGFETYFLSEARTEHERRVAAIENAPLEGVPGNGGADDTGLGFILNELRNHDHQHWSALLAEMVQEKLAPVHPAPSRGVKQAPFAVITNALMPSVLVEVGFISNREEERLLARPSFHDDVAGALADAVVEFFGRYPPGRTGAPTVGDPPGTGP